jgi:hypothetical protein
MNLNAHVNPQRAGQSLGSDAVLFSGPRGRAAALPDWLLGNQPDKQESRRARPNEPEVIVQPTRDSSRMDSFNAAVAEAATRLIITGCKAISVRTRSIALNDPDLSSAPACTDLIAAGLRNRGQPPNRRKARTHGAAPVRREV